MGTLEKSLEIEPYVEPTGERSRLESRLVWLTFVLTALPFVVGAVALLVHGYGNYHPAHDLGYVAARVDDVWGNTPLLGQYSRADWAHPGPMQFYVLAPFSWLVGGDPIGIRLGALLVNGAAVVGMVWLALRRGGVALMMITAIASSVLMTSLGGSFLNDPWNCFLPVLPFALLIFLVWSAAVGDRWALPWSVFVASFVAQTHVSYVALAIPLVVWGTAWLVLGTARGVSNWRDVEARRSVLSHMRVLIAPGLVSGAVLVLVWLPTIIDTIANFPGNASRTVTWFSDAEEGMATWSDGWRVVAGPFSSSEWLAGRQPGVFGSGESPYLFGAPPRPWFLLVVGVAAVVMWRIGGTVQKHFVGVIGCALVLGIVAVSRTVGLVWNYRLRWTWVLPMLGMILVLWLLWLVVASRYPAAMRWAAYVAAAFLVVLVAGTTATAAESGNPQAGPSEIMSTLGAGVLDADLGDGGGVVLVREGSRSASHYARGLVHYLERAGLEVRVDPPLELHFGEHRTYQGEEIAAVVVIMQGWELEESMASGDFIPIAHWPTGSTASAGRPSDEVVAAADDLWSSYDAMDIGPVEFRDELNRLIAGSDSPGASAWARRFVVFLDKRPPEQWPVRPPGWYYP